MKTRNRCVAVVVLLIAVLAGSVPAFSADARTYTVRKGDNLYRIARSFNTTPEFLKEINGLKNNNLSIGQVLQISVSQISQSGAVVSPAAKATGTATAQPVATTAPESKPVHAAPQTYTVRRGDSLYQIAKSLNLDLQELKAANQLKNNSLTIGQTLVIPGAPAVVVAVAPGAQTPPPVAAKPKSAKTVVVAAKSPAPTPVSVTEDLSLRDRLVQAGFQMLGVRYRFGGTSEKTGLDCSALVKNLFAKVNLTLPRSSREQYQEGEKVAREDLQKGDLVFFSSSGKTPTHVGIYIGDNQFLHAARKARQVTISDLNKTWYNLRYLGARRIMDLWWEDLDVPEDFDQPDVEPVDAGSTATAIGK